MRSLWPPPCRITAAAITTNVSDRSRTMDRSASTGPTLHALMHVVFTLPCRLAPLVLQNKKVIYDLCFAPVQSIRFGTMAKPVIAQ
jgi:hypothetical protein